ncbi:1-deoxy-D-xylulose-5-phosphate reductoisomerase [Muribaculaceae bacterium Isolate-037 (Harlan)]|uniref:1-deoxy-D-xylulose-5-phosphate reductoisomerase n=1 Tax=Lepagella muris TaxID=3032870 RepID=A0AC61RAQ6_9BACT|nr:1-deoxy-D-xylulose-5-phosphate reductoisomerase [Muribaculaceae bacterium Isolate-037 (Harlan)]TGY76831.1 1-deoxy-D-xylulose-5-phosphate reductoisomerase [Lepagella muris]THG48275.1 1-deoxy-D-xylulose-5-phosphate reductoisomerase [Bacteroidales bacterium]TKC57320.1 1-deoxy-D-xylulose-5-phosphate reductoisomerase [Bacteroidales bacterium]
MVDNKVKNIAILGSTGSIGTQTLDIIEEYPERFHASVLTARRQWELLARQARKFMPKRVVIADHSLYAPLKEALSDLPIDVAAGEKAIAEAATLNQVDIVVTAMVGYSGLIPTIEAIKAGKTIALANKETLVVAGEIITRMIKESPSEIIPVDSEHSAIFQCLVGEKTSQARKIILTASGGPFRNMSREQLENVTVADALKHPNWDMGAKVTIDSASMMNKGFEMIEARWLFGCPPDKIEVVVHPQSIVHSMVEFNDGSIKAQLGVPDMHLPIRYALGYPERLSTDAPGLTLSQYSNLTFQAPDYGKFPLLAYAFDAIKAGGNMPCLMNAANEKGVAAFLAGRIRFTDMPRIVSHVMENAPFISTPSLDDLIKSNSVALSMADEWLAGHSS